MFLKIIRKFKYKTSAYNSTVSLYDKQHKRYLGVYATIKTCIVGAGPAGFYAAQYLLKQLSNCEVDIIEKLPVPFGLVRFGVAPDHPEVKNVINTFRKVAENSRFHFYGNVELGKTVTLQELRDRYHAVLLTYGANQDRQLRIPNESQSNCISARDFVAWYNGLPDGRKLQPNLMGRTVTIIGQGNVAIDVARILLSPIEKLQKTDITSYAWEALSQSKVEEVYLIGRRSPLQVACTIKELREILKLPKVKTVWRAEDFHDISNDLLEQLPRPRKRLTELMLKSLQEQQMEMEKENIKVTHDSHKLFLPRFLRSPKRIEENRLILTVNEMHNTDKDRAVATQLEESLKTDLILRSIGYKASCADDGICFDRNNGRVCNNQGRVLKSPDDIHSTENGLYVAGWLATGPNGVILTTMSNAYFVAKLICDDIKNKIVNVDTSKPGISDYLIGYPYIDWEKWCRIDAEEVKRGQLLSKHREKIVDIDEMLQIAGL